MLTDNHDLSGIRAVIFDLDGTLLDTEKLLFRYWREAAAQYGYEMSPAQALTLRSLTHRLVQPLFTEWFGDECDYKELRSCRMKLMQEHIDRYGVETKPGAAELLAFLGEHGYMRAIATATDTERAGKLLKTAGLDGCFDRIVCASMVEWGKPRPDIYLYAAEQLGLSPAECIAVEDSPNGVISAHTAGCFTVMVPDLTQPDKGLMQYISAVCDDLTGIEELLIKHI
ncbi:MAG: HAD family phosphatase [Ruminiclostridium sp.]|nr:HAD family phosphatase [Ruminiclostridium sp.]